MLVPQRHFTGKPVVMLGNIGCFLTLLISKQVPFLWLKVVSVNQLFYFLGYTQDDKCSLCKTDSESLYHIFFECRHSKQFWKEFQYYYYTLTREFVCLTLQDVITGILYTNCPLLNYLILIAKLYLWGCRRNQTLPVITAFSSKVKIK